MRMVRSVLVLASCLLSATACWGGAVLIAEAHGNPLGMMPQRLLRDSPFRSWAFPGIFLFSGVGLLGIWTLWVNLHERPNSGFWSAVQGSVLLAFMLFWRMPVWLNYFYGVLALILVASGLWIQSICAMRGTGAGRSAPRY